MKLIKIKNFKIGEEIITDSGRKGIIVDDNCPDFFSIMALFEDTDVLFFDKNGKSENNNIYISSPFEETDINRFAEIIEESFELGDILCIMESRSSLELYNKTDNYMWIIIYGGLQRIDMEAEKIRILSTSGYCIESDHTYCNAFNVVWGDIKDTSLIRMATESEIKLLQQRLKL